MNSAVLQTTRLETERLVLRQWSADDLDGICGIFATDENTRFIGGRLARWQCEQYLMAMAGHWQFRGWGKFAVEEKSSGRLAGFCGPDQKDGWEEPEIAYSLAPEFQGKGYALEAVKRSIRFVFEELGWQRAVSQIEKANEPSRRIAQKLGATVEREDIEFAYYTADIWRHLSPKEFLARFA